RSSNEVAPIAPSRTIASTGPRERLYTTHSCPPRMSRRTMLAPIRPRPIIPICIEDPPSVPLLFPPGRGKSHAAVARSQGRTRRSLALDDGAEISASSPPARHALRLAATVTPGRSAGTRAVRPHLRVAEDDPLGRPARER